MNTITMKFILPTSANAQKIWPYYVDFLLRKQWENDLEQFILLGELTSGVKGIFKLRGMPAMDVTLSTVTVEQELTEQFNIDNIGILSFSHQIIKISAKQFAIKAVIALTPHLGLPDSVSHGFLKEVSNDIMIKAFALKELVEG